MSKGSKRRPAQVDRETVTERWAKVFGPPKGKDKPRDA